MAGAGHAAIIGSTASGKSQVAHRLALDDRRWEIVTVDSMQVYRGMDIGTAKPTVAERAEVPHHLLDVADPADAHDLATHQTAALAAIDDIEARDRRALLVGGAALYLRAIVDRLQLPGRHPDVRAALEEEPDTTALHARLVELDPVAAARMEPTNRRRVVRALEVTLGSGRRFSDFGPGLEAHPPTDVVLVGLRWPRPELDRRIDARVDAMIEAGLLDEVAGLLAAERPLSATASQALGYRELALHLSGACSLEEAIALTKQRVRQFSRRQEKWFRRDPRIRWVDVDAATPWSVVVERVASILGSGGTMEGTCA